MSVVGLLVVVFSVELLVELSVVVVPLVGVAVVGVLEQSSEISCRKIITLNQL